MHKRRWTKPAFILCATIALIGGNLLKRKVISSLGGKYSLLTEFSSDVGANLMHKFNMFRDFSLIAAFVCSIILWLLILLCLKTAPCAVGIAMLYALSCSVYFFCFLGAPTAIALFAVKRALYSSLFITAPILLSDKPLP